MYFYMTPTIKFHALIQHNKTIYLQMLLLQLALLRNGNVLIIAIKNLFLSRFHEHNYMQSIMYEVSKLCYRFNTFLFPQTLSFSVSILFLHPSSSFKIMKIQKIKIQEIKNQVVVLGAQKKLMSSSWLKTMSQRFQRQILDKFVLIILVCLMISQCQILNIVFDIPINKSFCPKL